jgi:hypothetical protein
MIKQLASPSVCVVDDEERDYKPILAALNEMHVSCVHLLGNNIDQLPGEPFKRVQLVFLDLHLNGAIGKGAASHTANVFRRIVSPTTAPIVVVIWSKYAKDKVPNEDDGGAGNETEAELFKNTLFAAEPQYKDRVIFLEMAKPMAEDRPGDWAKNLKQEIENALKDQAAVEVLWAWDSMVKDAASSVSEALTTVAADHSAKASVELKDSLKETLARLAQVQGENDVNDQTAPSHLMAVLGQLLADQLEHSDDVASLAAHGVWLAEKPQGAAPDGFAAQINSLLLTAAVTAGGTPFIPGTVYGFNSTDQFASVFGKDAASLIDMCCDKKNPGDDWRSGVKPVAVELSPVCDVAQNYRANAMLLAGLVVPASLKKQIKRGEAFVTLPVLNLRSDGPNFPAQECLLVFCHRYKATLSPAAVPAWLQPWFRLRELPSSSIRNLQAAQSARVGYVLAD